MLGFKSLPVLLLGYQRPDYLRDLLSQLQSFEKIKLYISVDGYPSNHNKIKERVIETGEIARSFANSNPNVKLNISTIHRGCYRGVSSAIDWFFSFEKAGLILEDDLAISGRLPEYTSDLLAKFELDYSVGSISFYRAAAYGNSIENAQKLYLSPFPTSWGWATWRDRWIQHRKQVLNGHVVLTLQKSFLRYGGYLGYRKWMHILTLIRRDKLDSWAYRWLFTHWLMSWGTIVAPINLIENKGFGENATHTMRGKSVPIEIASDFRLECGEVNEISKKMRKALLLEIYGVPEIRTAIFEKFIVKP